MNKNLFFKGLAAVSLASAALIAYAEGNTIRIFQKNEKLDCEQIVAEFPASSIGHLQIDDISNAKEVFTVNGVSFTMIRVDGGSYQMGSTTVSAEQPVHNENVCTFYICETETTNAIWNAVMGSKPTGQKNNGDDYPVTNISWLDCHQFLEKLTLLTGKQFRLPTETEWEYAARGGKHSGDNYLYSGSNDIDEVGWYKDNSKGTTHPVKTKSPNQLGIYDMTGNIWEICENRLLPTYDSTEAHSGRTLRSGSWDDSALNCRVAARVERSESDNTFYRGFRIAF